MTPLLDTHTWIWWIRLDPRVSNRLVEQLDAFAGQERPYVADVSLWEVAMLVDKGRLELPKPVIEWLTDAAHPRTVRVVPISPAIAGETHAARALRDPADRLIVSTIHERSTISDSTTLQTMACSRSNGRTSLTLG